MDCGFFIRSCVAVFAASLLTSCDQDCIDCWCYCDDNQPPQVWLAAGPAEGSVNPPTVEFFWGGWDPDGDISHYEYLIIHNVTGVFVPKDSLGVPWAPIIATDSTFTLEPDSLETSVATSTTDPTRSYTFFVRAVDNEQLRSVEPGHRTFYVVDARVSRIAP